MEENKSFFKKMRDQLQQLIYLVINPFVRFLIKIGFTPNAVTTVGFLGNVAAAVLFIYAGITYQGTPQYALIGWAGAVLILSSLFDMLDGQVARLGGMASTFGAMYDSVLDRYSELVTLGGICYLFIGMGYTAESILTFVALVGSIMVSYVRARAEGLGLECKIGLMQRPERVVVTCVAAMACGLYGTLCQAPAFDPMLCLTVAMGIIAVLANLTAIARILHSRNQLTGK